ncbi:carboxypeptidase regulatory-like domain-containing protein [Bacteroides ovatus]|uniref:TonB-dependent receptor n=1 Tax=Bacteroides TaxID=816 RepID=UPI0018971408|nr:TonB-dependent receptor [Bacteroides ovatus]MDC2619262.1 carboxypeptidase regulatory-like domain-containing protein [Bacteroides ovatus]MDC2747127.1 carboxypeptidase regulatory-like domain-containing protein [Bacteroides ovatus]MDC2757878.1 carboxypeptidase regulatory-like domain-containing protein [Bacteroides ovatus]
MLKKMRSFLVLVMLFIAVTMSAQVTTATMSGKVTAQDEPIIGATVVAVHEPSGTRYGTVTNVSGQFNLQGMRTGGPYKVEISYVGYQTAIYKGINLSLGENYVLNVSLKESSELLDEIVVTASKESNMKSDRAGAVTNLTSAKIASIPTVSRSMNDIMRLSPQSNTTSNGFAAGGGNYRQSFVTVDGASFNNAFGIGSNLPAGGAPISLDALEQLSVSITPYDVRQSGFTGAAINAVTKSGTNELTGSAYTFLTNNNLIGDRVGDGSIELEKSHQYTYGATLGGAIVKNKLFFFVNGEYEDDLTAGPVARARNNDGEKYGENGVHRPVASKMDEIRDYLINTYDYDPGAYQGYNVKVPSYKFLARVDWNINENNRVNVRFSKTNNRYDASPSSSVNPMTATTIFPGDEGKGMSSGKGASSDEGLYFRNTRYRQEQRFTSIAAEWNSKWGMLNNTLRGTYSYQDEPRSYDGGTFPTTYILEEGAVYAMFGTELFTEGNLRQVKSFTITDEATWTWGKHNFMAGLQFESNKALNGYMQGANGAYVFSSWNDFVTGKKPSSFLVTHSNSADLSQFTSKMRQTQYSAYIQDQWNISENFKLTAGLRFELPVYPSLKDNYNAEYAKLDFGDRKFTTDQVPGNSLSVSPRVGFNWDITGERRYVLRGGTGYFVGRMPFVWLVSAVGNSGVGQTQYGYNIGKSSTSGAVAPGFHTDVNETLDDIYQGNFTPQVSIPGSPTIIDKDLKMPATWKTSLAFDAKLPGDIDFTLEGIYNRDFNPAVISNANIYADGTKTISKNDIRTAYKSYNAGTGAYLIENGGSKAYYLSLTAQLHKNFDFGLDASFAYTYSRARSYGDGIGDQVTSAYKTNTYAVNGINDHELGYGTYVAPHRIIASLGYSKAYAKHFRSSVSFIYEGAPLGYAGGSYSYSRYSYTYTKNIVGDGGANNLLYVPATKDELTFKNVTSATGEVTYSAEQQKEDFWNFVQQDKYLKKRLGKYAERGGAVMPWHHQLDFKFNQDFYMMIGGKKNLLQFGIDIQNLANLLNKDWGLYKTVNSIAPLADNGDGTFTMQKVSGQVLNSTYKNYASTASTYRVMFSLRYIFN